MIKRKIYLAFGTPDGDDLRVFRLCIFFRPIVFWLTIRMWPWSKEAMMLQFVSDHADRRRLSLIYWRDSLTVGWRLGG